MINSYRLISILLLQVIISNYTFSKDNITEAEFDSVYFHIASTSLTHNLDNALSLSDSLYKVSKKPSQQIRSLLLKAYVNENMGKIDEAVYLATKAEKKAQQKNHFDLATKAAGYISSLYQSVNLHSEAERYLLKAEQANAMLKDDEMFALRQSIILHDKAFLEIEKGNYENALKQLHLSEKMLDEYDSSYIKSYSLSTIYESFIDVNIQLENYQKAQAYVDTLKTYNETNDDAILSLLNGHIGKIALEQNNYDKSISHLNKALEYSKTSENMKFIKKTYDRLHQYFSKIKDYPNALRFQNKIDSITTLEIEQNKVITESILEKLRKEEESWSSKNKVYILIISILVILLLISVFYIKNKRLQLKSNLKKDDKEVKVEPTPTPQLKNEEVKSHGFTIPKETELRILKNLKILEENKFFLSRDVSLSATTSKLNSNTRYVSQVIRKNKNKDFTSYVNELKINYVIDLWKNDPKAINYKLSHIAELSGFTSHSNFTFVFKKLTKMTPSNCLEKIKKENLKKQSADNKEV
ncbi:hypothetical protein [Brumimicrobium aurantiacum]|uniref:HTH araC/xylS-type domain-containing protein n=1 Tax=Brumimicrobium aurantiacum TaxID=1737063 RepID=A0A3E1F085_9FLAO|nr:hypothetical protein [Brumimicrobium aurantiacum]RFC55232.1 hypothetical protein DXU93_05265 [Brumimicrobium aurantiacum]